MACSVHFFLVFSLIFLFNFSVSQEPVLPKAAIIPVSKDPLTLQYVTQVLLGEKLAPVKLVVDVNGPYLWVDCAYNPLSKSQNPIKSCSIECSMAKSSACTMSFGTKSCTLQSENPISRMVTSGNLAQDRISMEFEDGVNSGFMASIDNFLFSCVPKLLLEGIANGAKGVLGLGNTRISLPTQIAGTFGFFQRRFSLCLSSSDGLISLAESSDVSLLGGEISRSMVYTPLISKPSGAGEEYKINVKSIKISGKKLSMNQENIGGAKISTTVPYTTMQSKIYGTFVDAYIKAATSLNISSVAPVAPFGVCFRSKGVENSRMGPNVPIIDLVLQSEMVKWRIYGRNSMVQVSDEVMCLGFLDGGLNQRDPFVIGGYQLEDYVLEFHLGTSMLGISSSLLMEQRKCSDFKLPKKIS
ncbi:basic 7S globulin-like [Olea europaea subsp. europaea]|uniref:Basic 7S globulin-like n=1 Tax=Olea europaea subsp. europaea TaxID=158383 RepID=A0A8S0STI4_OLEEU|nr:basic 7S globulin-like [Olea europaea subsp. europaea]